MIIGYVFINLRITLIIRKNKITTNVYRALLKIDF